MISKTNAAKQLEKQLSTEDVSRADPNRRSINTAELNFALQTSSIHRSRQSIGAASTHSSTAAINELPYNSVQAAQEEISNTNQSGPTENLSYDIEEEATPNTISHHAYQEETTVDQELDTSQEQTNPAYGIS